MPNLFRSNDVSMIELLSSISKLELQLPDFQRGWVWDDHRIKAIIASISNSYPVGAVMFLNYGGDNVRFKYRAFTGITGEARPEWLVLDGQQRLTSVHCALYSRNVVETKTEKHEPIKRYYYLDIAACLNPQTDRIDAVLSVPSDRQVRSDFGRKVELDLSSREKEFANHMFPLNIVYDLMASIQWQNEYQQYHGFNADLLERFMRFCVMVLNPIQSYKLPVITLDKSVPKEAVCQVFENVNTGGVALTVFELVTATFAAEDFELRKDWEGRRQVLTQQSLLSRAEASDFLTAMALLAGYKRNSTGGPAVSCKKKDVLGLSLSDYISNVGALVGGFIASAKFLQEQRIFSSRDLPYTTQLIPMAAVFTILNSRAHTEKIKSMIARWYWCGVFGEMYGGASETRYALDVTGLMAWIDSAGPEPDTISRAYFNPARLLTLQTRLSAAYKGIMALLLKAGCLDFISGSAMDFVSFLDENTDIHHVFPKAFCEAHRIPQAKWNSIINKTPLFARTNRILGGKSPRDYLQRIEHDSRVSHQALDSHITSHKIDVAAMRTNDFDKFFVMRAYTLLDLIGKAMGKTMSSEDAMAVFGDIASSRSTAQP